MPIYELGQALTHLSQEILSFWPGDGTLGISGWGLCRWDPGTLTLYQSWFSRILLLCTRVNSPNPPYPRVAVFQKLLTSLAQSSQNKTYTTIVPLSKRDLFILLQFVQFVQSFSGFLSLDRIFNQLVSSVKKYTLF